MNIKSFIRPPTESNVGNFFSNYRNEKVADERGVLATIKKVATRIFKMFAALFLVSIDIILWTFRTVLICPMLLLGPKKHFVNLISLIAAAIFSLSIPLGGKPKADQTRYMYLGSVKGFASCPPYCASAYDWIEQEKESNGEVPKFLYLHSEYNSETDFSRFLQRYENGNRSWYRESFLSFLHKFLVSGVSLSEQDLKGNAFLHRLLSTAILIEDPVLIENTLDLIQRPPQHRDYPIEAAQMNHRNQDNNTALDLYLFQPVYRLMHHLLKDDPLPFLENGFKKVNQWAKLKEKYETEMAKSFQQDDAIYKTIALKLIENGMHIDFDYVTTFRDELSKILEDLNLKLNGRKVEDIAVPEDFVAKIKEWNQKLIACSNPYSKRLGNMLQKILDHKKFNEPTKQQQVILFLNHLNVHADKILSLKETFQVAQRKRFEHFPDIGLPPQILDLVMNYSN